MKKILNKNSADKLLKLLKLGEINTLEIKASTYNSFGKATSFTIDYTELKEAKYNNVDADIIENIEILMKNIKQKTVISFYLYKNGNHMSITSKFDKLPLKQRVNKMLKDILETINDSNETIDDEIYNSIKDIEKYTN